MATKTAKTSKKEANTRAEVPATSSEVNMAAQTDSLEEHRVALAAEFKAVWKLQYPIMDRDLPRLSPMRSH